MQAMKRTLVAVATAFAVASTAAMAEGVKMSDEQLDQVTAAGARTAVILSNPGNASVTRVDDNQFRCINCAGFPPNEGRAAGVIVVFNPKFDGVNNPPLARCVGGGLPGFPC